MNSPPTPEGPGSVAGAPHLPDGFAGMFTSRYIDTGELRQHVVTGGDGPPVLLIHGWPQTWYAWRLVMPALARDFTVIAPDQRGCGLSGKPRDGYDTGPLAADLAALMDALPYGRPTGLCTALATTAYQDEGLSLQPCSVPGTTVWILDAADSPGTAGFPIVNGSDTDFVHPFAMTILGNPAGQLFTPIIMQHLTKPGSVPANQLRDAGHGPV